MMKPALRGRGGSDARQLGQFAAEPQTEEDPILDSKFVSTSS
jgi:hypothetical protein